MASVTLDRLTEYDKIIDAKDICLYSRLEANLVLNARHKSRRARSINVYGHTMLKTQFPSDH
jgi:hypothetical protein